MILDFLMLNFKPTFSLSSFTLIKRLFSSSSLSAIRVVSSAYLDVIDISILITAYNASSPAFHMMYSAYDKLNKQSWQYRALLYSFLNFEPVSYFM